MSKSGKSGERRGSYLRRGSSGQTAIQEVALDSRYLVSKQLGTGRFGYVSLATDKSTGQTIALKLFDKNQVKTGDVLREYNFSYLLSAHHNVIDTYEGLFSSGDWHYFAQEYCKCASLREHVIESVNGIPERAVKIVLEKICEALLFMHKEGLVHRSLQAKNVLIFERNYSRIKLTDFGLTRKDHTMVRHFDMTTPFHAPELCDCLIKESYAVEKTVDIWAIGILTFYCLRGRYPWEKATIMTKTYWEWEEWVKGKRNQMPKTWLRFTERGLKLFKKTLHPKAKNRTTVKDILTKYLKPKWLKDQKNAPSVSDEDIHASSVQYAGAGSLSARPSSLMQSSSSSNVHQQMRSLGEPSRQGNLLGVPGASFRRSISPDCSPVFPKEKRNSMIRTFFVSTVNAVSEISDAVVSAYD